MSNKTPPAPPPPPLGKTPPTAPQNVPTKGRKLSNESVMSIATIATTASRARKRISLMHTRPLIAFIPEDGIEDELLMLEEQLDKDHHLHNIEAKRRNFSRLTDAKLRRSGPSGQPSLQHLEKEKAEREKKLALQRLKARLKDRVMPPAYDGIPRPFTEAQKDIERRRARKYIDIMNSSKEVFNISEKDSRVKFCPSGTLIFHILELSNLTVNDNTFIRALPVSFYCIISIGSVKRCTKIVHSKTARRVRVDYTAHFSIEVPEWRESPLNKFQVELWSYQDPEMHYIVGSMDIHVYEFVRKVHAIEEAELSSDGIKSGKIHFEYAFTYGTFGYGHSNYLKNPKNPIMETVCHSMYPRVRLEDSDLVDKVYRARLPLQLKMFTYNSLILELADAIQSTGRRQRRQHLDDFEPKPIVVQQVSFEEDKPVHCKVHMNIWQTVMQADFNDTFGEFVCIGTRKGRLDYLNTLVQGRMRDIQETDAGGSLFRPFGEREAERVQRADINHPGYLVHPTRLPCPKSEGVPKLDKDDERFMNRFPAVQRGPGYLAEMFGYEKKPAKGDWINDMEFPAYKDAGKAKKRRAHRCYMSLRKWWISWCATMNWLYNFVFPEVRKPPPVPEISLTIPTPEGSTTNVFSYFIKDNKEAAAGKMEKLQAQTAALIDIAQNPLVEDDEASNPSSSEEDLVHKRRRSVRNYKSMEAATIEKKRHVHSLRQSIREAPIHRDPSTQALGMVDWKGKTYPPKGPHYTGPGGHFKEGINQPLD